MRRSPAGVLLIASFVLFALAISTTWMQRVAFSPSADTDLARSVMEDDDIRGEVASLIAGVDAPELGQSATQLKEFIEQIARIDAGAALMTEIVRDAHARLIGELEVPVRITAQQQVQIVRDERVALMPPITLPVEEVGSLRFIDTVAGWVALVSAGLGVLLLIGGVVVRPERGDLVFATGVGLGSLGVLLVLLGWLVPALVLPALSDDTWMAIFPSLAASSRTTTLVAAAVCVVAGAAILLTGGRGRQRRQFSTPLSVGRYREQHSWSR